MTAAMAEHVIQTNNTLADVKYAIRGQLAHRAYELEKRGYEILSLNIGNPGLFGFRTPETMRLAMIENLGLAEPYSHPKGIFPAREAVVMQQQERGVMYDQMVYDDAEFIPMATLVSNTVCLTCSGLSKVYRACGYRVGWCVFTGELEKAESLLHGMELLAALRLCSNVPVQWAVQTALGGYQSIRDLVIPGGRLFQSRQAVADAVERSRHLSMVMPQGAMYAFIRLADSLAGKIDHRVLALDLLESKHVLVAPGSSFNTPYSDHFRITTLPDPEVIKDVFSRIESLLEQYVE
jgi:aspartate/methionine/tyrosine aminotransferase